MLNYADSDNKKHREIERSALFMGYDGPLNRLPRSRVAAVTNAQCFLMTQEQFGSFNEYFWAFVGGSTKQNRWKVPREVPASTSQSDMLSKDLKRRGFRFVGTTICYAFMQAVGMVNDHLVGCFRYNAKT
jgi:DNA-3-methyladenine glycosylase I